MGTPGLLVSYNDYYDLRPDAEAVNPPVAPLM